MSLMVLHTARAQVPVLQAPTGALQPQQLVPLLCRLMCPQATLEPHIICVEISNTQLSDTCSWRQACCLIALNNEMADLFSACAKVVPTDCSTQD